MHFSIQSIIALQCKFKNDSDFQEKLISCLILVIFPILPNDFYKN